ncbi:MAG: signal recognition particle-docking protein FtsY, partial [Dermatophilaceae bacterium]
MSAVDSVGEYLAIALVVLVVVGGGALALVRGRAGRAGRAGRETHRAPQPSSPSRRADGDGAVATLEQLADAKRGAAVAEPDAEVSAPTPPAVLERPEAPAGRLRRLRARLARSNTALG